MVAHYFQGHQSFPNSLLRPQISKIGTLIHHHYPSLAIVGERLASWAERSWSNYPYADHTGSIIIWCCPWDYPERLQKCHLGQNSVAHMLIGVGIIIPNLWELCFLPVPFSIQFKVLVMIYKLKSYMKRNWIPKGQSSLCSHTAIQHIWWAFFRFNHLSNLGWWCSKRLHSLLWNLGFSSHSRERPAWLCHASLGDGWRWSFYYYHKI